MKSRITHSRLTEPMMVYRGHRRHTGFTMIELMIVVAIAAILLAVAVPAYTGFIEQSRRSDAIAALQAAASEQSRFFSENTRYATSMIELDLSDEATALSEAGYYTLSVTNPASGGFVLKATPVADGPQASDTACAAFELNHRGGTSVTGTAAVSECW